MRLTINPGILVKYIVLHGYRYTISEYHFLRANVLFPLGKVKHNKDGSDSERVETIEVPNTNLITLAMEVQDNCIEND